MARASGLRFFEESSGSSKIIHKKMGSRRPTAPAGRRWPTSGGGLLPSHGRFVRGPPTDRPPGRWASPDHNVGGGRNLNVSRKGCREEFNFAGIAMLI